MRGGAGSIARPRASWADGDHTRAVNGVCAMEVGGGGGGGGGVGKVRRVVTGSEDGMLWVWDAADGSSRLWETLRGAVSPLRG